VPQKSGFLVGFGCTGHKYWPQRAEVACRRQGSFWENRAKKQGQSNEQVWVEKWFAFIQLTLIKLKAIKINRRNILMRVYCS
jgi:hypothetical protein